MWFFTEMFNMTTNDVCNVNSDSMPDYTFDVQDCNCSIPAHIYEDCGCDYPDLPPGPPLSEIVPPGIIYGLVFLIGTVGNTLVIFVVVHFKNMRNVTNMFLASLSTADLCLIWLCVPIQYMKCLAHTWVMGGFLCYGLSYVQQFSMVCSVLTLTVLSVERYMAIAYPMRSAGLSSTGRVKRIILTVWIVSAFIAIPAAVKIDYTEFKTARGISAAHCMRDFPKNTFGKDNAIWLNMAYSLVQFVLFLLIPVGTMSFCYIRIGCIVYRAANEPQLQDSASTIRALVPQETFFMFHWLRFWRPSRSSTTMELTSNRHRLSTQATGRRFSPSQRNLNRQATRTAEQSKKQIVQMLIMIVVLYVICWTPSIIDDLLVGFRLVCPMSNTDQLQTLRMIFGAMAYTQSSLNPIVYAFMSKHFRRSFADAWKTWTRRSTRTNEWEASSRSTLNYNNSRRGNQGTTARATMLKKVNLNDKKSVICSTSTVKRVSVDLAMCQSPSHGEERRLKENKGDRRRSSNHQLIDPDFKENPKSNQLNNKTLLIETGPCKSIISKKTSPKMKQNIGFV